MGTKVVSLEFEAEETDLHLFVEWLKTTLSTQSRIDDFKMHVDDFKMHVRH